MLNSRCQLQNSR